MVGIVQKKVRRDILYTAKGNIKTTFCDKIVTRALLRLCLSDFPTKPHTNHVLRRHASSQFQTGAN